MSDEPDSLPGDPRPRPRFELLWAALALAALVVAFLWNPITRFSDSTFAPVDFMQELPLTHVQDGWHPGNQLISDVSVEYHPWYLFDRDEILHGKMPLWNRFNGFGVPHLANFQSAVFSPLTLAYYLFSFKAAALLTAFAKVFCLLWFTYLFLRALQLAPIACYLGAVVYAFSAHNILRLGYSQSSVAMIAPAGLWAVERIAQGFEHARRRGPMRAGWWRVEFPRRMAAFVLVLVVGILLGHPETFYFALGTSILYATARGIALWIDHRDVPRARRDLGVLGVQLAIAGVLAALVAMVQLLPFFEYLRESFIFGDRTGGGQTPLATAPWPCLAFPNLLGNPSQAYFVDYNLPKPDFDSVTLSYVGLIAMMLAAIAPFFVRRRRILTWFFVMGIVWVLYAYGLFGTQPWFELVPTLKMVPINRSQFFGHICVAVCAAFLVDRIVDPPDTADRVRDGARAVGVVAGGLAVLYAFRAGAAALAAETWKLREGNLNRDMIPSMSAEHMHDVGVLFLVGVACVAAALILRARVLRLVCMSVLVLAAYLQTGGLMSDYNPITPDRMVYPSTPMMETLRARTAGQRCAFLGPTAIPPHTNAVYGIPSIAVWDGINIKRFELLRRLLFSQDGNWQDVQWATTRGLQLYGIGVVLDTDGWIDVDTAFGFVEERPDEYYATTPIVPGQEVEIDFNGFDDAFCALRVCFASGGRTLEQTLDLALTDKSSGELIAQSTIGPRELDPLGRDRVYTRLNFTPPKHASERTFTLRVASPDGVADTAWSLVGRKDYGWNANRATWRHEGYLEPPDSKWHDHAQVWQTRQAGRVIDGQLTIDLHYGLQHFRSAGSIGPYSMYEYKDALSRYHTVSRAYVVHTEGEASQAVTRRAFDPVHTVVLEEPAAKNETDAGLKPRFTGSGDEKDDASAAILREDNGHIVLQTTRTSPGWLVVSQAWYPGWKARVNGVEKPILHANYAFGAVALEPGASRIELDYEPRSVVLGAAITLLSALACAIWLFVSARSAPLA